MIATSFTSQDRCRFFWGGVTVGKAVKKKTLFYIFGFIPEWGSAVFTGVSF